MAVPRMGVGGRTATALAMVVHELATNSVKHGALSCEAGTLDIFGRTDQEELELIWAETGGPAVTTQPDMTGFGSKLIARSVASQLGGAIAYDWQPTGLVATLSMRKARLAA